MTVAFVLSDVVSRLEKAGGDFQLFSSREENVPTKGRAVEERVWWIALALLTASFAVVVEKQPGMMAMILHETNWLVAMFHAIGYRVFCFFFLGPMLMYPPLWHGWAIVSGMALAFMAISIGAAVLTTVKAKTPGVVRAAPLVLLYLIPHAVKLLLGICASRGSASS